MIVYRNYGWDLKGDFATNEKIINFAKQTSPGGGMVDALVSGASAARRAGSSPVLGTPNKSQLKETQLVGSFLFKICTDNFKKY